MSSPASARERKRILRALIRERRAGLRAMSSDAEWRERAERLAEETCATPAVRAALDKDGPIGVYLSQGSEPPTDALIARLLRGGATVVVPEAVGEEHLAWHTVVRNPSRALAPVCGKAGDRVIGAAGLVELGCDVVLTPALAVGRDLARLGQGGGHFDRLIATVRTGRGTAQIGGDREATRFLAIVGPQEVLDDIPTEDFDQPVDGWICG